MVTITSPPDRTVLIECDIILQQKLDGGLRDDTDTLTATRTTVHSLRD